MISKSSQEKPSELDAGGLPSYAFGSIGFLIRRSEVRVLLGALPREHGQNVNRLDVTSRQSKTEVGS